MLPEENTVIVNLHNWNGESCISEQAYERAEKMNVKLLTMDAFYEYIKKCGTPTTTSSYRISVTDIENYYF